jgi:hypothetical protein
MKEYDFKKMNDIVADILDKIIYNNIDDFPKIREQFDIYEKKYIHMKESYELTKLFIDAVEKHFDDKKKRNKIINDSGIIDNKFSIEKKFFLDDDNLMGQNIKLKFVIYNTHMEINASGNHKNIIDNVDKTKLLRPDIKTKADDFPPKKIKLVWDDFTDLIKENILKKYIYTNDRDILKLIENYVEVLKKKNVKNFTNKAEEVADILKFYANDLVKEEEEFDYLMQGLFSYKLGIYDIEYSFYGDSASQGDSNITTKLLKKIYKSLGFKKINFKEFECMFTDDLYEAPINPAMGFFF